MRFLYFSFFLITLQVCAQKPKEVLNWINTAPSENRNFYFEIPFSYRNDEIVIQVRIGNHTYDYIFDTGGYNNITDAIQGKNNFPILTRQTVGSSNKIKKEINIVKLDSLHIGSLAFHDLAALQMNFDESPTIKCTIDGGLIGASIIKNYIWQIDYPRKKIIVTDQIGKIANLQKAIKVPVTFNSRLMPYIEVRINGKKEKMMFDLGSSTLFSMTEKAAKKHDKENVCEIIGGGTEGGNGTIKESIYVMNSGKLEIKNLYYSNKPILYTSSNNESLIGNPIIKDYIVTLNFKDDEMYFLPVDTADEGWITYGFTLKYDNGKTKIATLLKGSTAEKAGLRIDDVVEGINGKKIDCQDFCMCKKTYNILLEGKNEIVISLDKDGKTQQIRLEKQKIF
ncbi:aspartyl protease family protein [Flavobacterium lindanitolerans]|uniref:aspartyl protease family protein n=1 Tax=Flavobacterium lindanitolerans TaxID=428988 RepID=UPI0027B9684F|nr:aspartyl protease family protein [Flavobacterium lindanitolerans]